MAEDITLNQNTKDGQIAKEVLSEKNFMPLEQNRVSPYAIEDRLDIKAFLSPKMKEAFDRVQDKIGMCGTEAHWKQRGIEKRDAVLRLRFWRELDYAYVQGETKLNISHMLQGLCSRNRFDRFLKHDTKAAYLFTKPTDHNLDAKILLDFASQEVMKILELPNKDSKGKVIPAVVAAKLKAYKLLSDRVLGLSLQRVQQHSVVESRPSLPKDLEAIEEQIKALEKKQVSQIPEDLAPKVFDAELDEKVDKV